MTMRWVPQIVFVLVALLGTGCTGRKQVPFGLEAAGGAAGAGGAGGGGAGGAQTSASPQTGQRFEAGTVEVPVGDNTMVLDEGYALAALRIDLDDDGTEDALVVSAAPDEVRLLAGYPRGMTTATRVVDSFRVPNECAESEADLSALSDSLVAVRVAHTCPDGIRQNWWIVSAEAQPRVRERLTLLPATPDSNASITVSLRVEDVDGDGYEDIVAEANINDVAIPLTWLNRPGGFARDVSQPEATLAQLADDAAGRLGSDPAAAGTLADRVLTAVESLCRESGEARFALSGTQGLQCQQSPATGKAVAVATEAAIRRGNFVRALALQRAWNRPGSQPAPEDRARVDAAWKRARERSAATWKQLDTESAPAPLYFEDDDTLVVGGPSPRKVSLSTGTRTSISASEVRPMVQSPEGRFRVLGVRVTCAGFEAVIAPTGLKRSHRVTIERAESRAPCRTPIDRPASPGEWSVLGWAPQGLIAASGDRLRIVPLNASGKAAGPPVEVRPGSPLPAPARGAGITPEATRYLIAHPEGLVVRDWKTGATGLWLRPPDWDSVPGEVRNVAISPDGRRAALQKGSEIRLISW